MQTLIKYCILGHFICVFTGAQWLSSRVLDLRPRAEGSSLTSVAVLCHRAKHIYPSLVLVQPRKTGPCLTERLLMGRKESNQTNQLSMKLIMLINVKMPRIVGILTFTYMINTTSERLKTRNFFICWYFSFYEQLKFRAQLSWAWKNFYNLGARSAVSLLIWIHCVNPDHWLYQQPAVLNLHFLQKRLIVLKKSHAYSRLTKANTEKY